MNKKRTSIIIAVVVLLILAGGVFALQSHLKPSPVGETATPQKPAQQITTGKKSLADFLSMNATLKCTFSDKTDNSSGTVYLSNGKMRGDFQGQNNGTATQTHMVNDGTYVYYWTDGQKNGYKMSLAVVKSETSTISTVPAQSGGTNPQGIDVHQQSNYSCGPWAVNSSVFTVPSDITFVDYSSMMQNATKTVPATSNSSSTSTTGNAAACSECNQAPAGAARNQCLTALHCQ